MIIDENKRPHAFELINYLNKVEKEVYGQIVSDETKNKGLEIQPSTSFTTMSPNTSGSFTKSFDSSFNSEPSVQDYNAHDSGSKNRSNLYLNNKKQMKLNSKSKEFVKPGNFTEDESQNFSSQSKNSKLLPQQNNISDGFSPKKFTELGTVIEK